MLPGLAAWYRFEDTTGLVCDSSGNGFHGTVIGTATRGMAGKFGAGISFYGMGRVNVPVNGMNSALDMLTAGTYEFWLRLHQIPPPQPQVVYATLGRGTGNGDNHIYTLTTCGDLVTLLAYGPTMKSGGPPCGVLSANVWAHVAVVNDGTSLFTYVNDKLVSTDPGGALGPLKSDLSIGELDQGVLPMDGDIDEVKWWTVARTASEICTDAGGAMQGSNCSLPQ
jgi:hypothetical protein